MFACTLSFFFQVHGTRYMMHAKVKIMKRVGQVHRILEHQGHDGNATGKRAAFWSRQTVQRPQALHVGQTSSCVAALMSLHLGGLTQTADGGAHGDGGGGAARAKWMQEGTLRTCRQV